MRTVSKRLYAYIIDYICGSIFISLPPMVITSIITQQKEFTIETFISMPVIWQAVSAASAFAASAVYFIIYPMNPGHLGQTPGKQLMKIRVEAAGGYRLTYGNMLKRELLGSVLIEGETAFPSAFFRYFLYQIVPAGAAVILPVAALVISVGSILWAVFGKEHRMIHDYIGGTVVRSSFDVVLRTQLPPPGSEIIIEI